MPNDISLEYNSSLKTGLQKEGAQKFIYIWLRLQLSYVGHLRIVTYTRGTSQKFSML